MYGRSRNKRRSKFGAGRSPRQVFASGANREMAHRKTVAPGEDLGDALPVAALPIGLLAQKAARCGPGDVGGALQVEFGPGVAELVVDDRPKPVPTRSDSPGCSPDPEAGVVRKSEKRWDGDKKEATDGPCNRKHLLFSQFAV
jgi:hypothetical protein